jgi:3-mercaptopyruvate sulfurtransferase SseA
MGKHVSLPYAARINRVVFRRRKSAPPLLAGLAAQESFRAQPVAVYCKGGYRSAIAASLLERAGFEQVLNVTGGFDAWSQCRLPAAIADPAGAAS